MKFLSCTMYLAERERQNNFDYARHVSTILLPSSVAINTKYKVDFIILYRMLINRNNKKKDGNRPFYSCVFSDLALDCERGWR